jgi:HPr kinase/phosphorylase
LGIRRCDFAEEAKVGLVVDLAASDAERVPVAQALQTRVGGILIPRIPVARSEPALRLVLAGLITSGSASAQSSG